MCDPLQRTISEHPLQRADNFANPGDKGGTATGANVGMPLVAAMGVYSQGSPVPTMRTMVCTNRVSMRARSWLGLYACSYAGSAACV